LDDDFGVSFRGGAVTRFGELEKSVAHYAAAVLGRTIAALTAAGRTIAGEMEKSVAHGLAAALRRTGTNLGIALSVLGRPARRGGVFPSRRALALGAIATVIAVALAMRFLDAWAIAQTTRLPSIVVDAFNWITDFGSSGWFLWPTGLMVLLLAYLATPALGRVANLTLIALMVRLEFIFFAVAVPGLTFTILKRLIGRARPSGLGAFHFVPFSWRPELASMPSGHSTAAFSAAIALGALFPSARPALWVYAVTIALSRVVIAAHFPSDVIAGAVLGAFGATIVRNYFAARRLVFVRMPDGAVRALPGPSLGRIRGIGRRILGHE
jgi:undecaprenyl-diphosphatase